MVAVSSQTDVIAALRGHRSRLRSLGVTRIGLFGSFARNEATPGSDVDLLVEFRADQKSFDNFMNIAELLETTLERRVELVTPESLSPYLRSRILQEAVYVSIGD